MDSVLGEASPNVATNLSSFIWKPQATRSSRLAINKKITYILSDIKSRSKGFRIANKGIELRDKAF
jgi:hypothetical protein